MGYGLAAALLVGLAAWALRVRPDPMQASAAALLVGLLASPVAWVHYSLFLLPIYFSYRRWGPWMWVSAIMWLWPVYHNIDWWASGVWWQQWTGGSLYTFAYLALLVALIRRPEATAP